MSGKEERRQNGKDMPPLQNSSGTDFPDPDVVKESGDGSKRDLEETPAMVPDFASPPKKRRKTDGPPIERVDLTVTSASDGVETAAE